MHPYLADKLKAAALVIGIEVLEDGLSTLRKEHRARVQRRIKPKQPLKLKSP